MTDTRTLIPKDKCQHLNFTAQVAVARVEDIGAFVAEIQVRCVECDEPFRFKGVGAGFSYDRPTVAIDGLTLHAPIEAQGEPALHSSASYEVPRVPSRN
jgi:hypothetical protein